MKQLTLFGVSNTELETYRISTYLHWPIYIYPKSLIFCRILFFSSRNRVSVSASQAQFPVFIEISFQDGGQPMRDHHHRGYIQRSSFLLKVRNQLSNLAGSLASALRRGRHPPLIVILNV